MQYTKEQIDEILENHKVWLEDNSKGQRANLRGADLQRANLREANLRWANLREANLREANLRGADLREADLQRANLREANLRWADLRGANLREANLRWADLREADLQRANLREANLREADLDYSCWPLSCKTSSVKLCKKLQAQLLAHAFQVSPDVELPEDIHKFIKEHFHRYDEFFTRAIGDE